MSERTLPFVVPLTTASKGWVSEYLSDLVSGASIVGVGEMTHGCREHYVWREHVLRQLVQTGGFRTLVFEGHAVSMGALDAFVRFGSGSVHEVLGDTGGWLLANAETADLARWLRAFNEGLPEAERVHVYGCDFQSLDAHVALVRSVVPAAEHPKSLAALPTDSELFSSIEPVMAAIYDPDPDLDRIDSLLEEHGERIHVIDIYLAEAESAIRVELFGDEIERIIKFEPLTGKKRSSHSEFSESKNSNALSS